MWRSLPRSPFSTGLPPRRRELRGGEAAGVRKIALRLILLVGSLVFALIAAEFGLRFLSPRLSQGGHQMNFAAGTLASFEPDPEAGYLPKLNSQEYDAFGCLHNQYKLEKPAGVKRILFLGDSVTHRGRIINGLRKLYGDKGYEYWNAGVESFNTLQELVLYRRHNAKIKPDQVILTFHNNDFMQTPIVYQKNGKMEIMSPLRDRRKMNMWLFDNSYFYRFWLGMSWKEDNQEKADEVRDNLADLQKLLADQKVDFRVVLLPLMKPSSEWYANEKWSREQSLKIFKELNLTFYDLLPTMEKAAANHENMVETAGDAWHPDDKMSAEFAEQLYREKLLLGH
jgi:hypothetical protein